MALSLGQLNRAGLGATKFGSEKKTSGTSAQATRNLANSSAATRVSHFDFKSSKRTNFVVGRNNNINLNKYDYSRLRGSLGNGRSYQQVVGPSVGYVQNVPNMNNFQTVSYDNSSFLKGMFVTQTVFEGVELLNNIGAFEAVGSLFSSSSKSASLDSSLSSLSSGNTLAGMSSKASSAISSMSSADNSIDLRGAIANANGALDQMDTYAENANFQANYNDAVSNKETYKSNRQVARDDAREAKQGVSTANNTVNAATDSRDDKLRLLKNADAEYGKAVEAHTQALDAKNQATQNLSNAEATLNSTDPEITVLGSDGKPKQVDNPAYAKAKKAVDDAKEALRKANDAETKARGAREEAKKKVDQSNTAVTKAEQALDAQQAVLDKAKQTQTDANNKLIKADANFEKADVIYDTAKDNIEKYKEYKQDRAQLVSEISEQQQRLAEMEKEEQQDYSKLTNKINKQGAKNDSRYAQIDTSDGMSIKERWLSYKAGRTSNKMDKNLDKKEVLSPMVADSQYIQQLTSGTPAYTSIGGEHYYTGETPSGQMVYYRGNTPITEEMYKAETGTGV